MLDSPTDQDLEDLAVKIVEKEIAGFRGVVSEKELKVMKAMALSELLATPEGRMRLRRCFADPARDKSGDRALTSNAIDGEEKGRAG